MNPPGSHFDFLGYRFKCSNRSRLIKLVRRKSLRKLRESIKPQTKRSSGRSIEAMAAELNRNQKGWDVESRMREIRQSGSEWGESGASQCVVPISILKR